MKVKDIFKKKKNVIEHSLGLLDKELVATREFIKKMDRDDAMRLDGELYYIYFHYPSNIPGEMIEAVYDPDLFRIIFKVPKSYKASGTTI